MAVKVDYKSNLDAIPSNTVIGADKDGKPITISELKANIGSHENPKPKCLIVWDDCIQFTTLGAALLFCVDQDPNIQFNVDDYFKRNISEPEDFLVANVQDLTKDIINEYLKEDYTSVLMYSPKSSLFKLIFTWAVIYEDVHIVFKHRFEHSKLLNDIKNEIFTGEKRNVVFHFLNETPMTTILDAVNPDMVISRNMKDPFLHMTIEKKKPFMMYIGPIEFNGLDIEFMQAYLLSAESNPSGREEGPLGSQFRFFEESLDGV